MAIFILCLCVILPSLIHGDTGYFWHVTDFHYDFTYHDRQLSCNPNDKPTDPGDYGDFWCDSPWLLVNSSILAMADIKPDVDFILWTGDSVLHTSDDNLNYTINDGILTDITDDLIKSFPNVPTYASFGNHDYWPNNQFPPSNNPLYNDTLTRWKNWINDDTQHDNFLKGAYYTVKTKYGLRIISLNTNLYYTSNKAVLNVSDPADQLAWLNSTLAQAKGSQEKVLITAHIPPGVHTPNGIYWMHEKYHDPLVEVLQSYTDVIVAMHFGHDHADGFKIMPDLSGTPGTPIFIAPSVTPWRYVIPNKIGHAHNPGIRLVKYDRQSGKHLDIYQYYLDLTEANTNGVAQWQLLYNFSSSYSVPDLTVDSIEEVVSRIKSASDSVEMTRYWNHYIVNPPAGLEEECDDNCFRYIVCGFTKFKMDNFVSCEKQMISSAPFNVATSLSYAVFAVLLFVRDLL